jgi:hypothetical protein
LDEDDLAELQADLGEFHEQKGIFETKGVHKSRYRFNGILKLHILRHYMPLICEMGTPDNYSTEGPEHLHIDYVKEPYARTNRVEPEQQMTIRLEQQEAWDILQYELEAEGIIEKRWRQVQVEEEPIDDEDIVDEVDSEGEIDEIITGDTCNDIGRGLWVAGVNDA